MAEIPTVLEAATAENIVQTKIFKQQARAEMRGLFWLDKFFSAKSEMNLPPSKM